MLAAGLRSSRCSRLVAAAARARAHLCVPSAGRKEATELALSSVPRQSALVLASSRAFSTATGAARLGRRSRAGPGVRGMETRELVARAAEAEVRVVRAEASAALTKAEAATALAKVEAAAALTKAEAEAAIAAAQAEVRTMRVGVEMQELHRCLAEANSTVLSLRQARNVRGAAEHASERISRSLMASAAVQQPPRGVQNLLDAALKHERKLAAAMQLLAARHRLRLADVEQSFAKLYHTLSKGMHGVEGEVVVREEDFPAPTERLALCALLETYDESYRYVDAAGETVTVSPYALTVEERLSMVL